MWLNNFKVALIEKDIQSLDKLLTNIPTFTDIKSMQEASYLLKEASELLQKEKKATALEMHQIKKTLDFLNATNSNTKSNFDIKS